MPKRTVSIGVMTYTEEGGLLQFALLGSVINVADEDVERFDRLNGTPSEPEPTPKPKAARRKRA